MSEAVKPEEHSLSFAQRDKYLTMYLEGEVYGLDIGMVKEIIAVMNTTSIPKTPEYLEGVMNLRGNIIPVVNTRKKFGMATKETDDRTAIIIVSIEGSDIGMIVDGVEEVISVEKSQYSDSPQFESKNIDGEFIAKMARMKNDVVMILDIGRVFSEGDLDFLGSISQEE